MNLKNTILKITTATAVVISFIACEDDFGSIGSNIVGEPNFNAELYDEAELKVNTFVPTAVQTNNLPLNLLGVYPDNLYGTSEASILSNLILSTPNPTFGTEPVIDSVVLTIPYFSREEVKDNETTYVLDSVYGKDPIQLTVRETRFFLNTFDPENNFESNQKYYSNAGPKIESNYTPIALFETQNFTPSKQGIVEFRPNAAGESDTVAMAPALRIKLNNDFFQTKILDKEGTPDLLNQNNFNDYFRSIYLKAEQVGQDGSMMLLNLQHEDAGITLYYKIDSPANGGDDADDDEVNKTRKSYKLNFGGTRLNTFEQDTPKLEAGENLFLKGGEGSMAVIELFAGPDANGDGVSDELEYLRDNDWLLNEANLEFYVNRDYVGDGREPERLFIYDLNNNRMLVDYVFESPGNLNNLASKSNEAHLVPLERDENGKGIKYKVRMTRHIDNILNRDSTNVKLGVVVSQNVNIISNSAVLPVEVGQSVKQIPTASIIAPEGTVLYGPQAQNSEKRLKLNIYYTESKK